MRSDLTSKLEQLRKKLTEGEEAFGPDSDGSVNSADAEDDAFVSRSLAQKNASDITLKRAAMESERDKSGNSREDGLSLFARRQP